MFHDLLSAAKDLIEHLLVVNIPQRYTAVDVLCHPWVVTQGGAHQIPNMADHRQKLREKLETESKGRFGGKI